MESARSHKEESFEQARYRLQGQEKTGQPKPMVAYYDLIERDIRFFVILSGVKVPHCLETSILLGNTSLVLEGF